MPEDHDDSEEKIEGEEEYIPSPEAENRKARSIARLQAEGIPVISHLPPIEDSDEALERTKEEIARRAIGVCLAGAKSEGIPQDDLNRWIEEFGARSFFSPDEMAFIGKVRPTEEERNHFGWGYESYWVFLWALGYVEALGRPEKECNVAEAIDVLQERGTERFIEEAVLRPLSQILDEADLIYRYNWAATDALIKEQDVPAGIHPGVVEARHHALNWLIGYLDEEWDEVSTDT